MKWCSRDRSTSESVEHRNMTSENDIEAGNRKINWICQDVQRRNKKASKCTLTSKESEQSLQ